MMVSMRMIVYLFSPCYRIRVIWMHRNACFRPCALVAWGPGLSPLFPTDLKDIE